MRDWLLYALIIVAVTAAVTSAAMHTAKLRGWG